MSRLRHLNMKALSVLALATAGMKPEDCYVPSGGLESLEIGPNGEPVERISVRHDSAGTIVERTFFEDLARTTSDYYTIDGTARKLR